MKPLNTRVVVYNLKLRASVHFELTTSQLCRMKFYLARCIWILGFLIDLCNLSPTGERRELVARSQKLAKAQKFERSEPQPAPRFKHRASVPKNSSPAKRVTKEQEQTVDVKREIEEKPMVTANPSKGEEIEVMPGKLDRSIAPVENRLLLAKPQPETDANETSSDEESVDEESSVGEGVAQEEVQPVSLHDDESSIEKSGNRGCFVAVN